MITKRLAKRKKGCYTYNPKDPLISLSLRRHVKQTRTGTPTKKGLENAQKLGQKLSKKKLKTYASPTKRTKETLNHITQKHSVRIKQEVNENSAFRAIQKTLDVFKNLVGDNKVGNKVAKMWMNNKISTKIIKRPKDIADLVIKKRCGVVLRLIRQKERQGKLKDLSKASVEVITHAGIIMPVFERLTNQKYYDKYKRMPNNLESLTIRFIPFKKKQVKIFLVFRKKKYDVTERTYNILKKQKVL